MDRNTEAEVEVQYQARLDREWIIRRRRARSGCLQCLEVTSLKHRSHIKVEKDADEEEQE